MKQSPTKKQMVEYAKQRLATDPECAYRCMVRVWKNHTDLKDGCGFRNVDDILMDFADQLVHRGWLSPKQTEIVLNRMPRYARQIVCRYADPENIKNAMIKDGWFRIEEVAS